MVGPRHMLTVSHGISWNGDGSAGWVQFRPSYFSSDAPFGEARGIHWYAYQQVTPPTIDGNEGLEDYCLIVLDRRMGDLVGWMGSRTYSEDWDSEGVWRHIGYPADLAGAEQPSYQRDISLDGRDTDAAREIWHPVRRAVLRLVGHRTVAPCGWCSELGKFRQEWRKWRSTARPMHYQRADRLSITNEPRVDHGWRHRAEPDTRSRRGGLGAVCLRRSRRGAAAASLDAEPLVLEEAPGPHRGLGTTRTAALRGHSWSTSAVLRLWALRSCTVGSPPGPSGRASIFGAREGRRR